MNVQNFDTIDLDILAGVSGAYSLEHAMISGAQWAPVGAAAGAAIGAPTGAVVGALGAVPTLGTSAVAGTFMGSMVGGAIGTTAGYAYGFGKDTYNQLRHPAQTPAAAAR
jgi:hypothetical protein